jgi:hypothetical protein
MPTVRSSPSSAGRAIARAPFSTSATSRRSSATATASACRCRQPIASASTPTRSTTAAATSATASSRCMPSRCRRTAASGRSPDAAAARRAVPRMDRMIDGEASRRRAAVAARRPLGRPRRQLRALFGARRRRRVVPLRRRPDARAALARMHRPGLARLPRRGRSRTALRLPRARPGRPENGHRFAASACCSTPTRAKSSAAFPGRRRTIRRTASRLCRRRDFDWGGDAHRRPPGLTRCSTKSTSREQPAAPGRSRSPARHLRRSRRAGDDRALPAARRHRRQPAAGAPLSRRATLAAKGASITGATTRSPSSRPNRATRRGSAGNR